MFITFPYCATLRSAGGEGTPGVLDDFNLHILLPPLDIELGDWGPMQQMTTFKFLFLDEEVVSKDGLFNAKQETSEEVEQGAEASGVPSR